MEILFEILLEVVGSFVFEALGEFFSFVFKKTNKGRVTVKNPAVVHVFICFLGFTLGVASVYLYGAQISATWLRITHLIVTPIIIGVIMHYIGMLKERKEREPLVLDHFLAGYLFALSFALTRFFLLEIE